MTVKMSSEGDSSKNVSSEATEKNDTDKAEAPALEVKKDAAEPEKATENNVEKKDVDEASNKPKEEPKDASPEPVKNDVKNDTNKQAENSNETEKKEEKEPVKKVEKKEEKKEEPKPKVAAEEEENDEKDDEEDSEKEEDDEEQEEKEKPLLDQPLEKTGKRERKAVQRLNEESKDGAKVDIPNGHGTALGNISRIDASIMRFKNDDMKLLHRVLFNSNGKSTMIKRNIKKFNGFDFKRGSESYKKKVASMQKIEMKQLKSICEMLDLQKTGQKDDIIDRILDFLLEPKDSGKAQAGGRPKRTAAVRANNRGYSSHDNYSSDERHSSSAASDEDFEPSDDGSDEKPPVKRGRRGERKKVESDEEEDEEEDASDIDSPSDDEEDSDFQDEPKSKRKKTTKTNNKAKGKGAKRGRKPAAAKRGTKATKRRNKESSEEEDEEEEESDHKEEEGSSSSEDVPLAKKAKTAQPPTDDDIKNYVKDILEGANLEKITMKNVCQEVYAHYPDFDLTHKKEFIKTTVKSLIST